MQDRIFEIVFGLGVVGFGVVLLMAGVGHFDRLSLMEAAGRVHGLGSQVSFLYALLGKWGVLVAYGIAGLCALLLGGGKLAGAPRPAPRRSRAA